MKLRALLLIVFILLISYLAFQFVDKDVESKEIDLVEDLEGIDKEVETLEKEVDKIEEKVTEPVIEKVVEEEVKEEVEPVTEKEVEEEKVEEVKMNTRIKMETNMGMMIIELFEDKAPKTTENFKTLVEKGFYDGLKFHRVIRGFMIRGGDPEGTGAGGPGYMIDDEFGPGLKHDKKGILSMANAGPNTGGSQFFITLAPTPHLNGMHAIFGEVVEGIGVLEKIGQVDTAPGDRPRQDVVMTKVSVMS